MQTTHQIESAPVAAAADPGSRTTQRLARVTGLLYLALAVFGMFSAIVLESLVVPDDAAATADGILGARPLFAGSLVTWIVIALIDITVAALLYVLLRPVGRTLSLLAAALRLAYAAVLGAMLPNLYDAYLLLTDAGWGATSGRQAEVAALADLNTFSAGFLLALVFFGVHLVVLGVLLHRSRYVPRVLAVLIVAAGAGYVVDSLATLLVPGYGGVLSAVLLAPAILGEFGLTGWLLVKGVDTTERGQAWAR